MAEKPIEDARSKSSEAANHKRLPRTAQAKQPIRSVRQGQVKLSSQSEAFAKDSSSEATNQVAFTKKRQGGRLVIQDRMVRIVSANQITWTVIEPLYHGHILWRIYKIGWSELYWPIRSLGRLLYCYIMVIFFGEYSRSDGQNRIGQSDHLDGYSTVINCHSLWCHSQDWMVRR